MKQITIIIFLLSAQFLIGSPLLNENFETVIKNNREYNTYYYAPDGTKQYLKQEFNQASLGPSYFRYSMVTNKIKTPLVSLPEVTSVALKNISTASEWLSIRNQFKKEGVAMWPVVTYHATDPLILTGKLGIKFKPQVSQKVKEMIFEDFNLEIIENTPNDPNYYLVKLPIGSNPFTIANLIFETGNVTLSQPDWYQKYELKATTPNDPYYSSQWHLPQINAPDAWDITTGSSAVSVAIVDSGVDTDHPDLASSMLSGYDFISMDNDPNPDIYNDDHHGVPHGTACAGLSAGIGNNGLGISGVCWNCKIIPIRLIGGGWNSVSNTYDALKFAVDQGASVVNNSWGPQGKDQYGNCIGVPYDGYQANAVSYGKTNGRSGKGTVMVWASGNDTCDTSLQPNLSNNDIIVVSALDPSGNKASYSNYGNEIDVSAGAGSHTTDIAGAYGYNYNNFGDGDSVSNLDYTGIFSGTSAAAPVTAGAIALMFSANQNLSFTDAMNCIKNSSDGSQVIGNKYCSQGSWTSLSDPYVSTGSRNHSPCYGFGKINTYNMVVKARDNNCGTDAYECTPTSDYEICFGDGIGKDDNCDGNIDENCENGGTGIAGEACSEDSYCANSGKTPDCLTDENFPGGYCSSECSTDNDCYGKSFCNDGVCLATCNATTQLRNGYTCMLGAILKSCDDSSCGEDFTCNKTTGLCEGNGCLAPGAVCSEDSECMGPSFCLKGICVSDCTMTRECLGDATCILAGGTPSQSLCLDSCGSTADCSEGNVCIANGDNGICIYKCNSDAECAGTCDTASGLCDNWTELQGGSTNQPDYDGDCTDSSSGGSSGGSSSGSSGGSSSGGTTSVCGNGILEPGEECDDGNNVNGDGCNAFCQKEAVLVANPVCGNGVLENDEECDDGNNVNGDGCSAFCKKEGVINEQNTSPSDDGCSCSFISI